MARLRRQPVKINWRLYHEGIIEMAERNVAMWERAADKFPQELAAARRELQIYRDTMPSLLPERKMSRG